MNRKATDILITETGYEVLTAEQAAEYRVGNAHSGYGKVNEAQKGVAIPSRNKSLKLDLSALAEAKAWAAKLQSEIGHD